MKLYLALTSSFVLLACGSSSTPPAEAPAAQGQPDGEHGAGTAPPTAAEAGKCHHIATACHEQAGFSELAKACHGVGHGGDVAQCEARHDGCLAECQEASKSGPHLLPAGGEGHKPGPH